MVAGALAVHCQHRPPRVAGPDASCSGIDAEVAAATPPVASQVRSRGERSQPGLAGALPVQAPSPAVRVLVMCSRRVAEVPASAVDWSVPGPQA